jgi:Tfp pilus assembly protein PilO
MENINVALQLNHFVQLLRYKLRQLIWQKLGWQGLLGLLLILASLYYWFIVAVPKARQLQQLQLEFTDLRVHPKQNVSDRSNLEKHDLAKVFYDALPTQIEVNRQLSAILRIATDNGLFINKVEYEQPVAVSPLIQYQIKLPLTGSYLQIRQFINQVLNTLPSIALSDISLKREDIAIDSVDTQIQFTLYLQKEQQ